ncbi:polyunsaturated fatty acid 5-lipoxygenase-like [Clytia hemisphaerica]|uniref:Lipoxygenase domain-containing protein n=1 Tax=Clytia hemisphaerica TaxID=252671 RepID=A0A7M5TSX5_9CNID|eukprot:TCONS_00034268-protein
MKVVTLLLACVVVAQCHSTLHQDETKLDEDLAKLTKMVLGRWKNKRSHRPSRPTSIPRECPVKVGARRNCQKERLTDIARARYWYKISDENTNIDFPLASTIPWLAQNLSETKYYYALDPFESRHLVLLQTWTNILLNTVFPGLTAAFNTTSFESPQEYAIAYKAWQQSVQATKAPQYFANPSQFPTITDHVSTGHWQTDEAFTQRRLTGQCPYFLKKVVDDEDDKGYHVDDLKPLVNTKFFEDFEMKYSATESVSIEQAIEDGRLFVLHIPEMVGIKNVPDVFAPLLQDRKLADVKSPISFFVLGDDGLLHVVAIQRNPVQTSEVDTSESSNWLLAKGEAEMASDLYCQAKIHLGEVHFVSTIYCLSFRRHLSTKHPLYDFFKHHCEGTVPHITTVFETLTTPNAAGSVIYGTGNQGFLDLSQKAFAERDYESNTYEDFIKGNGLDDEDIKYYPFRDDVKVIMKEYEIFIDDIIKTYYRRGRIHRDAELQSWANELSPEGTVQPDAGRGKMKGFPAKFETCDQLRTFLKRFLWINLFHTSANYPDYRDFMPTSPTRLYQNLDGTDLPLLKALTGKLYNVQYMMFRGLLANFRVNRIFSYWKDITNPTYRRIVRKAFYRLNTIVQKKLEARNAERKAKNQLGYQIMEPKWLTNSVHI